MDEEQPETSRNAYLSRHEALELAIESRKNLAAEWNTDDLAAIFARLRAVPLTETNIELLAKEFENTSAEDIQKLIDTLREVILEADANRFQHTSFTPTETRLKLSDDEIEAAKRLCDIVTIQSTKKKARISTLERLKDAMKIFANDEQTPKKLPASSDVFCPGVEYEDEVNYANIYKFLSEVSIIKKPKQLRPLESAILLNIFNDIQQLTDDYFDEHVDFFRELLCDLDKMKARDLNPLKIDDDQIGKDAWNIFDLPNDLVDLSAYIAKTTSNETANDEPSTSSDK
ncbi:hypothetical protein M3Y97_00292200 [Aphelenchoides bicaudatus]|nr:hypothetical protein M3Y97_00292200 [Aphelenchoides bicaudatus]